MERGGDKVPPELWIGLWRIGVICGCRLFECHFAECVCYMIRAYERAPFDHMFGMPAWSRIVSRVFRRTRSCNVGDRYVLC